MPQEVFSRIKEQFTELIPKCDRLKLNGKGNETPVADAATLVEIAWHLPGKKAAQFKRNSADLTLVDER